MRELEECLHGLERKQFVRRERRSSVAGETQYAFVHVLLRDVAYGQIPRAARAGKHVHAAGWIESLGRPEDQAEMLAHHYLSALELARAANQDTADLAPRARPALQVAGDRALALNAFAAAAGFYRAALAPVAGGRDGNSGPACCSGWRWRWAVRVRTKTARPLSGRARRCSRSVTGPGRPRWTPGWANCGGSRATGTVAFEHLGRAQALVRDEPASAGKAYVLSALARYRMLADEFDAQTAQEALELAEALGLDEVRRTC